MKYYITKANYTNEELDLLLVYGSVAGYKTSDENIFSEDFEYIELILDTDEKTLFFNVCWDGLVAENLQEMREMIDANPVIGPEDLEPEEFDTILQGGQNYIEDGDFMFITTSTSIKVNRFKGLLTIEVN